MSITTRRGDGGETELMFGRRVAKNHPRVLALGAIDEFNAALGFAHTHCVHKSELRARIVAIQEDLIVLMGEVGTLPGDISKYEEKGFKRFGVDRLKKLDQWILMIEGKGVHFEGWALPGSSGDSLAASLDHARAVCRRAERECIEISGEIETPILPYLNRLSDVLWLLARECEAAS